MNPRYRNLASMGTASKRSLIKRINQRIVSLAKRFGTDSETYQNAIAPLLNDKYSRYLGYSNVSEQGFAKKGNKSYLKINVNLAKEGNNPDLYDLLLSAQGSVSTVAEHTKRAKARIEERGEKATRYAIDEEVERASKYSQDMSMIHAYIYDEEGLTDAEAREQFPELYRGQNGGKIDYQTLDDIIEQHKEEVSAWYEKHKYNLKPRPRH